MRIKCPHCNGKGFSELNSAVNMTCGWCMGQGELDLEIVPTEQTTNEDFLRTATTEQLAEVLNKIFMTRTFCHICPEGGVCDIGYECKYHGGNTKDFVEWLKGKCREG